MIDTNVMSSFNRVLDDSNNFDGKPTSSSSSKIVFDTKSVKFIVSGKKGSQLNYV